MGFVVNKQVNLSESFIRQNKCLLPSSLGRKESAKEERQSFSFSSQLIFDTEKKNDQGRVGKREGKFQYKCTTLDQIAQSAAQYASKRLDYSMSNDTTTHLKEGVL